METPSTSLILAALAGLAVVFALIQSMRLAWLRGAPGRRVRAVAAAGALGESRAEGLLADAGFTLLARQVRGAWTLLADGAPVDVQVRADLLVAKAGRRYVAEVKTGRDAPRVDHIATRRQLLEYKVAFDVDGVLLVDAEAGRVMHVDVAPREARESRAPGRSPWALVFVAGMLVGAAVVLAIRAGALAR